MSKENRYVVKMEMHVFASDDQKVRELVTRLESLIEQTGIGENVETVEIGQQPTGTLRYNKI